MSTEKINVLFILSSLVMGGAEKHVITLVNELDTNKFNLSLGYLKNDTTLESQVKKERLDGFIYFNATKKLDFNAAQTVIDYVDKHSIDIIVSTNGYPLIYSYLASRKSTKKVKMIAVFHSTLLFDLKNKLQMLIYRPLFWTQKKLVYVCEAQRQHWRKRFLRAQSDMVIYNGVDIDYFKDIWSKQQKAKLLETYEINDSDFVIAICAALRPEKAHNDLIHAVQKLQAMGVSAKCLIIGDGIERQRIEQKISELKLDKSIFITGFIEDVRPYIAACDVVTIVSHAVETFSIAALEAMSLGKAVIMSDIGGAKEQIQPGKNGYLFPAGDIDALTQALYKLSSSEQQTEFGNASRMIVEQKYTSKHMIDGFDELLTNSDNQ